MDQATVKQLKQLVGEVVEEKIEQQVGKIVEGKIHQQVGKIVEEKIHQQVGKIVEQKLDEKLEEKLAPIYAWQKKADEKFANLPKEIMLIFGEGFDAVASGRLHNLEEQSEDHEKRIKKLEKTTFAAH
jgi:hypothetical protein